MKSKKKPIDITTWRTYTETVSKALAEKYPSSIKDIKKALLKNTYNSKLTTTKKP